MAMVISREAKLVKSDTLIGGLRPLLSALADFEYCCTIDRTNPAYVTAGIWVVEPSNPAELEKLKQVLHENSVFYAFNDGSCFVTLNNARMGNGEKSGQNLTRKYRAMPKSGAPALNVMFLGEIEP